MYRQLSTNFYVAVVAKVFERIIYNQLSLFLSENRLLNNCLSGFRGLHSTVTALLEATNEWAYNIDSGKVYAVMFLDLKNLTPDHEILLGKLKVYGVHGIAGMAFLEILIYTLWSSSGNYTGSTFIPNLYK